MAKKHHHDHPDVEINVTVHDDDCDPAPAPPGDDPTPDPQAPSPADLDEAAQAFYSAMSAQLGGRYARATRQGDPIEPWAQLSLAEQEAFRNGAFAILTLPTDEEPPP